jgi:hypothetical protein
LAPRIFPHEFGEEYEVERALNFGKQRGVAPSYNGGGANEDENFI